MTADKPRGALVEGLSWPQVESRLKTGAVPVFTVGAGAKEHGRHLPLDTDLRQAAWLGQAIAARWPTLVWPPLSYGHYPAFLDYPGSVSVAVEPFVAMVRDLLRSVAPFARTQPVVVNTGISTISPLDTLEQEALVVHVYRGTELTRAVDAHCRQAYGGHGDEAETSIMLAIAPDAVRLDAATPWDYPFERGLLSLQLMATNYSRDGVSGRRGRAAATLGRTLLTSILRDLSHVPALAQSANKTS